MVVEAFSDGQETAVLCSGGLDSAVLLAHEARGRIVHPVYVAVGLAWESAELRVLRDLLASSCFDGRVRPLVGLRVDMSDIYPASHWARRGTPPGYDTPDADVYLVGRNVVLLSKAGVYCAQHGIGRITIGPLAGNPFPDATTRFFDLMAAALSAGLSHPLAVDAPFARWRKPDVIRRGIELGVPLERTLSCMGPRDGKHCGQCSKCRERRQAFDVAGVPDPAPYVDVVPGRP